MDNLYTMNVLDGHVLLRQSTAAVSDFSNHNDTPPSLSSPIDRSQTPSLWYSEFDSRFDRDDTPVLIDTEWNGIEKAIYAVNALDQPAQDTHLDLKRARGFYKKVAFYRSKYPQHFPKEGINPTEPQALLSIARNAADVNKGQWLHDIQDFRQRHLIGRQTLAPFSASDPQSQDSFFEATHIVHFRGHRARSQEAGESSNERSSVKPENLNPAESQNMQAIPASSSSTAPAMPLANGVPTVVDAKVLHDISNQPACQQIFRAEDGQLVDLKGQKIKYPFLEMAYAQPTCVHCNTQLEAVNKWQRVQSDEGSEVWLCSPCYIYPMNHQGLPRPAHLFGKNRPSYTPINGYNWMDVQPQEVPRLPTHRVIVKKAINHNKDRVWPLPVNDPLRTCARCNTRNVRPSTWRHLNGGYEWYCSPCHHILAKPGAHVTEDNENEVDDEMEEEEEDDEEEEDGEEEDEDMEDGEGNEEEVIG